VEIYNNTCYGLSGYQTCAAFSGQNFVAAGINSFAKNNLLYTPSGGQAVDNQGTGNTISNNTTTPTANPKITNASGSYIHLSDFQPTANYSGGTAVPVIYDALGTPWDSTWDLGAVRH
jgi:hypothetical protein